MLIFLILAGTHIHPLIPESHIEYWVVDNG